MRIVIIIGAFLPIPPLLGGAVEKLWLAKAREFFAAGHDVWILSRSYKDLPDNEVLAGMQLRRASGYAAPKSMWRRLLLDLIYSLRIAAKIPPDCDILVTNTFFAPIIARLFTKAAVYVDVARMPKGQMRLYLHAKRLRATSTAVAKRIIAEIPKAKATLVKVIPNPLPFRVEAVMPCEKKKIVLFVGRVHPEKGLHLLTECSEAIHKAGWRLLIVGPTSVEQGGGGAVYLSELKKALSSETEFIGPIYDESALQAYYRECSIFVYPSVATYGETFGLAPLEAMAFGAVPVVSKLECFSDFVFEGENGFIFDHNGLNARTQVKECVLKLITNPELLSRLSAMALKVNDTHSLKVIAQEFLEDFKKLAQH